MSPSGRGKQGLRTLRVHLHFEPGDISVESDLPWLSSNTLAKDSPSPWQHGLGILNTDLASLRGTHSGWLAFPLPLESVFKHATQVRLLELGITSHPSFKRESALSRFARGSFQSLWGYMFSCTHRSATHVLPEVAQPFLVPFTSSPHPRVCLDLRGGNRRHRFGHFNWTLEAL